jgi:hypothetical protein
MRLSALPLLLTMLLPGPAPIAARNQKISDLKKTSKD